jgi:DNA-binding response OmpR family regulator
MPCVLVVDDELPVLKLAQRILQKAGFHVLMARNGAEALTWLSEFKVDVLLTDWLMPGLHGKELILEVRRRFPDLPICCMTATPLSDPHPELAGVRILEKPFIAEELVKIVRWTIDAQVQAQVAWPLTVLREKLLETKGSLAGFKERARSDRFRGERCATTDGWFSTRRAGLCHVPP